MSFSNSWRSRKWKDYDFKFAFLRLFEPTNGKILLDNTNILEFSNDDYQNIVSIVNQKSFIFNMSN